MNLPVSPPLLPMLAKRVSGLPHTGNWIFEPKWDGFRTLVFRNGSNLLIQSRDAKPLNRYFPDLEPALLKQLPERCVLDGEIVVARGDVLDFDALQLRVHPAASRVRMLAEQTPASVVFFDLLCIEDEDVRKQPFSERRKRLDSLLAAARPPLYLTPSTTDPKLASDWFRRFEGAGLDGVIAKSATDEYQPDKRVMLKVKHERECDCVVGGFRWHKKDQQKGKQDVVGSLLLGLYNAQGVLQHVGVCASFTDQKGSALLRLLSPYRENALGAHPWREWAGGEATGPRMPGTKSRWSQDKDLSWEPVRPELVVEVAYDHMQGNRFRHTVQFRRLRADKPPQACTYAQLEVVPPQEVRDIFGASP